MKKITSKFTLIVVAIVFATTNIWGQNSEVPPGIKYGYNLQELEADYFFPTIQNYSSKSEGKNKLPLKAGFSLKVDKNAQYAGNLVKWSNGEKSWIYKISVPDAPATGIILSNVDVPQNSMFFVYTPSKESYYKLSTNDIVSGTLSSPIFAGETIIVEYVEKLGLSSSVMQGTFDIDEVVVIYNGYEAIVEGKDLGNSEYCQVNINCSPEGDDWTREKRGVARILFREDSDWYWCSGTLVNNTSLDRSPLFLTADHCGGSASESDHAVWKFYFNYERPGCENTGTPPNNLITGCTLKARGALDNGSDFQLVLLSSTPPNSWNPYYNGWDRSTSASSSGVSIHHPSGDAKKISTYTTSLSSANPTIDGDMMAPSSAWRVTWTATTNGHGVTEGGSSGSPIFNSSGRVVGTLSGGSSMCSTPTYPDYYGKFSYHWESNGTTDASQLKPWLDPLGTDPLYLAGYQLGDEPYADFIAEVTTIYEGASVTFTDMSGGGEITSWSWNFGDGALPQTATTQGPHTVTYTTPGLKTVSLTVNGEYSVTRTDYITVLASPFTPPTNLAAEVVSSTSVKLTWDAPALIQEDGFEKYEDFSLDFAPWIQYDGDEGNTYGIQNVEFNNSGYKGSFIIFNPAATNPSLEENWAAHTGNKYAACFATVTASAPNDDWLITPLIKIEAGYNFNFWAKSITDEWGLERFKVGISEGGTEPADFTIISEGNYIEAPTSWTNYSYDLADYEGEWIRLAINCVSNDAFALLIDDIIFTDAEGKNVISQNFEKPTSPVLTKRIITENSYTQRRTKSSKDLLELAGYKVYRNGSEIKEINNPDVFEYTDSELENGTNSYQISSIYSSPEGESALTDATNLYLITFSVTDGVNPVNGAIISVNGIDYNLTTNEQGETSIALEEGNYNFSVFAVFFDDYSSNFDVEEGVSNVNIVLVETTETLYTVTFNVTSNSNAVEGAVVSIDGMATSLTTNASGVATIDLPNHEYSFSVEAENHFPYTGNFTVNSATVTNNVELSAFPLVSFTVTNANAEPVEGATISIEGFNEEPVSNESGLASVYIEDGTYNFRVNAEGYEEYTGDFEVVGVDVNVEVELAKLMYLVTFTVTGINDNPIQNAEIEIEGIEGTLYTTPQGVATINLENGTYSYTVSKSNYYEANGNFTVEDAAENVDVEIIGLSVNDGSIVNLTVFPNPFDESISFESSQRIDRIEIVNLLGQKIISIEDMTETGEIDASNLSSGIYIISFKFSNGISIQQKIVKK